MSTSYDDVAVTEEQKTEWNGVGDAKLVTDTEYIRQSISVSALQAYRNVSATPTPESLEELRGDIEQAVANNVNSQPPIDVTLGDVDYEESSIVFDIFTHRFSISETVSVE